MYFIKTFILAIMLSYVDYLLIKNSYLQWVVPAGLLLIAMINYGFVKSACENQNVRVIAIKMWKDNGGFKIDIIMAVVIEIAILFFTFYSLNSGYVVNWYVPIIALVTFPIAIFVSGYLASYSEIEKSGSSAIA